MINPKRVFLWLSFLILEIKCLRRYYQNYIYMQNADGSFHDYQSENNINKNPSLHSRVDVQTLYSNPKLSSLHITTATSYSKIDSDGILDWDSINVPERGYPKDTHLVDYPTSSTETEVEKHDRFLVQGIHYMRSLLKHPNVKRMFNLNDNRNEEKDKGVIQPRICLNIYLCNRRIPYINSLLMTLTSHSNEQSRRDFMQNTQLHLLNTEKRNDRMDFPYLKDELSKMPFVHEVHNITYHDEIYSYIKNRSLDFREVFISDTISGLKICIQSGLPYCVMMEEDAVVPVDFMTLLLQQVIEPLEQQGILQTGNETSSMSIISLYSYYNLVFFGPHRLHYPRYAKNKYKTDRSKMDIERWGLNLLPYHPEFDVIDKDYKYGTVAMLYTRESAIKLVKYLQKVGVEPIHNADEFMNADEYFPSIMGAKRKHVQPSLVNHIGYYSERMSDVKARGMFSQLNTDSRFMFDAGKL